ncbi:MAG: hypothetical protein WCK18_09755 [Prolixibacteraceae bacterium]
MENRLLRIFTVVVALGSLLTSCTKVTVDKKVYVDSYIHSIYNRSGQPVFSVLHSAFCYAALSGVSVKGSTGSATTLAKGTVDGFSFYTQIDSTNYKTTPPFPDTYTYTATYEAGDVFTGTELTSGAYLLPAVGLNATKTTTDIVLAWKPVSNAGAYKVRIFYDDGSATARTMIYESDFLVPLSATADLSIPYSLTNLSQYLNSYISFEVSAFIFQQGQDTYEAVSSATCRNKFLSSN